MRSPILVLKDEISRCAFQIAPERADVLAQMEDLDKFSLAFTDDKNFSIRVNTQTHEAKLPIAALEFLWCCANVFYVFYQEYVKAQRSGASTLDLARDPRMVLAIDGLNWSLDNLTSSGVELWPENVPMPAANPAYASDVHVANELFLCAIAWIIHHEIAHVRLKHGAAYSTDVIQQEKEADLWATDWILSLADPPLEFKKRTLGIAAAILALQFADNRPNGPDAYPRTHPRSVERLDYCFDRMGVSNDDLVYAFATALLQLYLAARGVSATLSGTSIRDIQSGFMVALARGGRS